MWEKQITFLPDSEASSLFHNWEISPFYSCSDPRITCSLFLMCSCFHSKSFPVFLLTLHRPCFLKRLLESPTPYNKIGTTSFGKKIGSSKHMRELKHWVCSFIWLWVFQVTETGKRRQKFKRQSRHLDSAQTILLCSPLSQGVLQGWQKIFKVTPFPVMQEKRELANHIEKIATHQRETSFACTSRSYGERLLRRLLKGYWHSSRQYVSSKDQSSPHLYVS